jgi:hypothetical protein
MTLKKDYGIKSATLNKFLLLLSSFGIPTDCFYFTFVVPSIIASKVERQPITNNRQPIKNSDNNIHQRPGILSNLNQYVIESDVFV